jgi:hypothetical protein
MAGRLRLMADTQNRGASHFREAGLSSIDTSSWSNSAAELRPTRSPRRVLWVGGECTRGWLSKRCILKRRWRIAVTTTAAVVGYCFSQLHVCYKLGQNLADTVERSHLGRLLACAVA